MLLTPGLKPVDPAFESWWVRPGGATRLQVRAGDRECRLAGKIDCGGADSVGGVRLGCAHLAIVAH